METETPFCEILSSFERVGSTTAQTTANFLDLLLALEIQRAGLDRTTEQFKTMWPVFASAAQIPSKIGMNDLTLAFALC
jgi:hypothetical protein